MSLKEQYQLQYNWNFWGRPQQLTPESEWVYWLILAGRGWGKTRTGAEWVRKTVRKTRFVNLIGATLDDARDIMIEGESGILNICPNEERPRYIGRALYWPNGAISLIFTADEPERLRGKQHSALWMDEVAAWRYPEAFDQAMLGLRLGKKPQACITTTPKPVKILRDLINHKRTFITKGTTYENRENLPESFFEDIITKYEGTRLGRQELMAELLDDMPGALWQRNRIDELRVKEAPDLSRVCVAIDPAVSTNDGSDETGIIVAGCTDNKHGYVLGDYSGVYTPQGWGEMAVRQFHAFKADFIIAEANNGGDLVESNIRAVDPNVPVKLVHASRGKYIRAEPVAALYEQGRVHHVGNFNKLEDQQVSFTPDFDRKKMGFSPDRMDACIAKGSLIATESGEKPIEDIRVGDMVWTRKGLRRVVAQRMTQSNAPVMRLDADGRSLYATPNHRIYTEHGWETLDTIVCGDIVTTWKQHQQSLRSTASHIAAALKVGKETIAFIIEVMFLHFMSIYGSRPIINRKFQKDASFITKTRTRLITIWITLCALLERSMASFIEKNSCLTLRLNASNACVSLPQNGTAVLTELSGIRNWGNKAGRIDNTENSHANHATRYLRPAMGRYPLGSALKNAVAGCLTLANDTRLVCRVLFVALISGSQNIERNQNVVHANVEQRLGIVGNSDVYDLQIDGEHEFFANGILVHNCVWAFHELILLGYAGSNVMDYIASKASADAKHTTA